MTDKPSIEYERFNHQEIKPMAVQNLPEAPSQTVATAALGL